jgi:hypothetical protein
MTVEGLQRASLDAVTASLARDAKKDLGDFVTRAEATRMRLQQPHTDAINVIRAAFRPLTEKAEALKGEVQRLLNAFAEAEDRRLKAEAAAAQEEALRRAREAAAAASEAEEDPFAAFELEERSRAAEIAALEADHAARVAANGPRIASAAGTARAAGFRTTYSAEVTDAKALTVHLAGHPAVQAEAIKVANTLIRTSKGAIDLPGCRIKETRIAV